MTGKRNIRLKTIGDVSRFLAKIINQVNRDEIDVAKASKLGYLSNILLGAIKESGLEERVTQLEKKILEGKQS